jgi:bifunctional non-homologous end joining protein LigD
MLGSGEHDLRQLPLTERKARLRDAFGNTPTLIYVTGIVAAGAWVFEQVKAHDFEGMVAKRLDSTYQRGRSNAWQKINTLNIAALRRSNGVESKRWQTEA